MRFTNIILLYLLINILSSIKALANNGGLFQLDKLIGSTGLEEGTISYERAQKSYLGAYNEFLSAIIKDDESAISHYLEDYINKRAIFFDAIGNRPDFRVKMIIPTPDISADRLWLVNLEQTAQKYLALSTLDGLMIADISGGKLEIKYRFSLSEPIEALFVGDIDNDKRDEIVIFTKSEIINTTISKANITVLWRGQNNLGIRGAHYFALPGDDRKLIYSTRFKPGRRVFRPDRIISRIGWYFGSWKDEKTLLDISDLGDDFVWLDYNRDGDNDIIILPPLEDDNPRIRGYYFHQQTMKEDFSLAIENTRSLMAVAPLLTKEGLEILVADAISLTGFIIDDKNQIHPKRKPFPLQTISDIKVGDIDGDRRDDIIVLSPRRRIFVLETVNY